MEITREQFLNWKDRRFGSTNPERIENPFWVQMIETQVSAYTARAQFEYTEGEHLVAGPVWCFSRFGMTETQLPDGRVVYVGGEHEDYYDPDFCIYNDVIVRQPDGKIEIYGYPLATFLPTDFHTATLVGKVIYIIGCLGYQQHRQQFLQLDSPLTPVFQLDCTTLEITPITTAGEVPGWISRHDAVFDEAENAIVISQGKQSTLVGETLASDYNTGVYRLDLTSLEWSKTGETKVNEEELARDRFHVLYRKAFQEIKTELGEDAMSSEPIKFMQHVRERLQQISERTSQA